MPRVLLLVPTSTYRASAFVEAARRLDADVTFASDEASALEKYQPADLTHIDFGDPAGAAGRIRQFAKVHPIDAVIGVDDGGVVIASTIASALSLPHNPPDAAYATRNKLEMRMRLSEGRVPIPGFRALRIEGGDVGDIDYPCVIKPLMMAASRGVIRADNPVELHEACERVADIVRMSDAPNDPQSRTCLLVEEYVSGWEVAVEGILTDGRLDVIAIFDKPDPLEGPYFPETIYVTPSRLSTTAQARVISVTQQATAALGLRHGPIHAELRGSAGDVRVIEVAARSIGGYCSRVLRFEDGSTLEDLILRHALGMVDQVPRRESTPAGVMMLQAPRKGIFRRIKGLDQARAVDGIEEILISAHEGQRLSPLPEGFLYAGFLFARRRTPEAVEHSLRAAFAHIEFVIEP